MNYVFNILHVSDFKFREDKESLDSFLMGVLCFLCRHTLDSVARANINISPLQTCPSTHHQFSEP